MGNKSSSSKGGGKGKGSSSKGGEQLIVAAKAGDIAAVTKLLQTGEFDINDRHEGIPIYNLPKDHLKTRNVVSFI